MLIKAISVAAGWLAEGMHQFWQTGVAQSAIRELLTIVHHAVEWLVKHPGGLVGGLLAAWLGNLFWQVSTTQALMSFAFGPLGGLVFFLVVVGAGVAIGSGAVEIKKRPLDDR